MGKLQDIFGSMVFNEQAMIERLPRDTYNALKRTIDTGAELDLSLANIVANAMKDWATEKGVTHFTHWFQPMTGITAEKHDSFISPSGDGGIIMEFSGKELIKGEPDASSFPSGGLRETFEARGYTAWDPTSYAFIKDNVLCIPTAFCSYGGETLDMKTPLLRSMEAIGRQTKRVLKLFGSDAAHVHTTVGAEQEYFLIDRDSYNLRKDLIYTGRTLFGARPPKGQEMDDHYYGSLRLRISAYMKELNRELWELGILAKTEHNEAAPAQHELAPIFTSTNISADHNQVTMEIMRKVAKRHGMTCLLHEKPFEGVNGSGKHNNWSMMTDTGVNLFEPGDTPEENAQFLLMLAAVIKSVDEYQDLLRISVASAGNDHRLGAGEAPPAIISIYIGEELEAILCAIESGEVYNKVRQEPLRVGVDALPPIPKDTTDRNRTSPFAFTGNKFEFRMVGAPQSIAWPNTVLNTIVADALSDFADKLENAEDFTLELNKLLGETVAKHKRILFGGNGYDKSWHDEAERRGLSNYRSSDEALPHMTDPKNIALFERHGILTETELRSRCEIMLTNYCKQINIEARTMLEMSRRDILPAAMKYSKLVAESIAARRAVDAELSATAETAILREAAELTAMVYDRTQALESAADAAREHRDLAQRAAHCRREIVTAMRALRDCVDVLETRVSKEYWPYPSYGRLLYMV